MLPAKECVYHAVYNRKQGIRRFALVTSGKRVSDKELEQITDTIVDATGIPARRVSAALTVLTIRALVRQKSGGRFEALVKLI